MDSAKDPFLGKKIRGFRLEELRGRGSMTATYYARTRELWLCPEVLITVFLIPPTLPRTTRRKFAERFERKGEQLITLRHTHLFPLYGYGEQEGIFYHILPLFSGMTLANQMRQQKKWSPQEVLTILNPIADFLDFIHEQGQSYQYLNPNNVLTHNNSEIQLIDFGLMQLLSKKGLGEDTFVPSSYNHLKSITDDFLSPPEYLAPEIVRGADGDARSDVYSLGIMLFELLSGTAPFTGGSYVETVRKHIYEPLPSLHEIAPSIPVALELVINHALHRNPERRFQTARAFVTAYTHVLNERLYAPKQLYISQAIEKIRALSAPATPTHMQLPSPEPQSRVVSSELHAVPAPAVYEEIPFEEVPDNPFAPVQEPAPAKNSGIHTPPPQPVWEHAETQAPGAQIQQNHPWPPSMYQAQPVSQRLPHQQDGPDGTLLLQWVPTSENGQHSQDITARPQQMRRDVPPREDEEKTFVRQTSVKEP